MPVKLTRLTASMALLTVLLLYGCGSAEPMLISKSSAVPAGIDLSGFWLVRETPDSARMPAMDAGIERLVSENRSQRSRRRSSDGVSAQVFMEFGESLKITQTAYGIFISYDRSVVEEFTFGENRIVEIGPIEAKRVSGWEGGSFVVETLDDSRTSLLESWRLEKDATVLVRDIQISKGEKVSFKTRQVFDRQ